MKEDDDKDREKGAVRNKAVAGDKDSGKRDVCRSKEKRKEPHVAKDGESVKSSEGSSTLVPNKPEPAQRIKKTENSAKNEVLKHRRRTSIPL